MNIAKVTYKSIIADSFILKPNFHLNYGKKRIANAIRNNHQFIPLGKVVSQVYTGGIFKRVFVENMEYGIPYISATHMMKSNPLEVAKIISKKYTPRQNDMTLRNKQILVSCAGTVGNIKLVGEDLDGIIGSQDIIRVIADDEKVPYGFIYAYLSTATAYNYIQSYIYGSVVPRIDPTTLSRLPVPNLTKDKQTKIHNLIVKSFKLRIEANKLLDEAKESIITNLNITKTLKQKESVNIKELFSSHHKRFEANYHCSVGSSIIKDIKKRKYKLLKDITEPIFRPGIFKRYYVDIGMEFLGGSDIVKAIPLSTKKLSKAKTKHLESLKLKEDWILVTCGGTIGYSVLVNNYLSQKTASQHILRVIANDQIETGYLFAFMSSSIGLKAIQSFTYGSVIPQIEPHHLELLPIPILEKEIMTKIHNNIMKYKNNINSSIEKENQAIDLIEKEIELWQK